jgi:uncharacterized membrane protein YfcA
MTPAHIAGTSMAMLLFNSIASTLSYAKQKRIDFKAGACCAFASIPSSILGAYVSKEMSFRFFDIFFGCFLVFISIFLVFKPTKPIQTGLKPNVHRRFTDAMGQEFVYSYNIWIGVIISSVIGFVASLVGIGGGSLLVPTYVVLMAFPPHLAAATSMFAIFLSAIVSTGTHWHLGNVDWLKVLFLAPGAFLGGQIGARIASRLPAKTILKVLAAFMVIVGIRLILKH